MAQIAGARLYKLVEAARKYATIKSTSSRLSARGERRKQLPGCCPPLVCSWSSISPAGTAPSGRTRMEGSESAPGRRAVSVRAGQTPRSTSTPSRSLILGPCLHAFPNNPMRPDQSQAQPKEARAGSVRNTGTSPCYGDKIIRRGEEKEERGVAFPSPHVSVRRWPGPARSCSRKGRGVCRPVEGWRPRRRRRPGSCLGRAWLRRRRARL